MAALPKGPRSALYINLAQMRDPLGTAERFRRKYGDPMTFPDLNGKPALVVGSPAALRTLLSAPPETIDQALTERLSAVLGESSLLALSGPKHTAMRKLLMPPFHGQRMRVYGRQIRDLTLQQTQDFKPGTRFVAQDLMQELTLQVIIHLVFGVTEPERAAQVRKLTTDVRRSFSVGLVFAILIPFLRREFWGLGPWARYQRRVRVLDSCLRAEMQRRRAQPSERTDILSLLMDARHEDGTALTDQQMCEQMRTLLFAGHSTGATTLAWALYFLSQHPEALARLQAELAALGPDPAPEAMAKAPFLEAVCNETLRLRPPLGAMGRQLQAPLTIAGHDLPAGSSIFGNILWAHTNPEVFAQPERFLPERFIDRTFSAFEFLPFGGGNRRCIGAAFAQYEMKLILGTLIQRFTFELETKKPVRAVMRELVQPNVPLKMIVRAAT